MTESKTTEQHAADGHWLDTMISGAVTRMEVRKTVWRYLMDMFAWWMIGALKRKEWLDFGNLPPDWYRPETDAEFRARLKARIDAEA